MCVNNSPCRKLIGSIHRFILCTIIFKEVTERISYQSFSNFPMQTSKLKNSRQLTIEWQVLKQLAIDSAINLGFKHRKQHHFRYCVAITTCCKLNIYQQALVTVAASCDNCIVCVLICFVRYAGQRHGSLSGAVNSRAAGQYAGGVYCRVRVLAVPNVAQHSSF